MIFFVMYDITDDKVRTIISKYLLKKGFYRIQKSVFMVKKSKELFHQIYNELKIIQQSYINDDRILILPINKDSLDEMKVIGQSIGLDVILKNKSTIFF